MLTLADLPPGDVIPDGVRVPRSARRAQARLARREFVRLVTGAALGTGLAFAGLFPTARPAYAKHLTPSTTSPGCYGPGRTGQALYGSTGCCSCGSQVRTRHCNSEGWHRHHRRATGPKTYRLYKLRLHSCKGRTASGKQVADGKNSWLWTIRGTDETWRCSDGQARDCTSRGCGSWYKTVCPSRVSVK